MTTEQTNPLFSLVQSAQSRAKADILTAGDCLVTLGLYSDAVAYCERHGLPFSSIRVLVGGGRKASSYKYSGETTFLSFDGASWRAYRGRAEKCAHGSSTYGSSFLLLEDLPLARKLGGRKVAGADLGKVVVASLT